MITYKWQENETNINFERKKERDDWGIRMKVIQMMRERERERGDKHETWTICKKRDKYFMIS